MTTLNAFLIIFFIILSQQSVSGQIMPGTYVLQADTSNYSIGNDRSPARLFISYPNLTIQDNKTFTYSWASPKHCIGGTTLGSWKIQNDTLFLKDSLYQTIGVGGRTSKDASISIETAYKIDHSKLTFLYTKHENGSPEKINYMGDFRFLKK